MLLDCGGTRLAPPRVHCPVHASRFAPFLLAALLALPACKREAPPPAVATGPPLRIGAYYWPGMYWIDIAWKQGWYQEAGLNAEWVDTNPNYFASFDDLANGKLDVVDFTMFDFILYNARGKDLVCVLATDYSHGAEAIVARAGLEHLRDLAGKRLALSKGTYLEFIFTVAAQRAGLRPADMQLLDVPGEKAHEELIAGRADAVFTWEPFVSQGLAAVRGKKLFSTEQIPGVTGGTLAVRRKLLEERPQDLQALLRVWHRTTEFIKQQPDAAFAIVAEVNKKTPAEVRAFAQTEKILDLRDNELAFSFAAGFDSLHGAWRQMNDFMLERGLVTNRVDSTCHLEARFLRGLK
jgi:NitT/TauT family transport system substrate-binding protein